MQRGVRSRRRSADAEAKAQDKGVRLGRRGDQRWHKLTKSKGGSIEQVSGAGKGEGGAVDTMHIDDHGFMQSVSQTQTHSQVTHRDALTRLPTPIRIANWPN